MTSTVLEENFGDAERCQLAVGIDALGLKLDAAVQLQLLRFLGLIAKWNRVDNLTAVTDPQQMVARHLLDSLAVVPYIKGPNVLDVGSGAGLPGIPLALACPKHDFVLLDSQRKRIRFMRQALAELAINNIEVVHARVEHYQTNVLFASVISRAFSDIYDFMLKTSHLLAHEGQWLAMKGQRSAQLSADLPAEIAQQVATQQIIDLDVPGLAAARCLIRISKGGN